MQIPNVTYRYLSPKEKIYIILKPDKKYPYNFGTKQYYTMVNTKERNNILVGFKNISTCNNTIQQLKLNQENKQEVDVQYFMDLSKALQMHSIVFLDTIDNNNTEVFYYSPNKNV